MNKKVFTHFLKIFFYLLIPIIGLILLVINVFKNQKYSNKKILNILTIIFLILSMIINLFLGFYLYKDVKENKNLEKIRNEKVERRGEIKNKTEEKNTIITTIEETGEIINGLPGKGLFIVGEEIKSGIYYLESKLDGGEIYAERLNETNGELDNIIGNTYIKNNAYIEINESDYAFHTESKGSWKHINQREKNKKNLLIEGIYYSKYDYELGEYEYKGNGYIEYLKDFKGEVDSVIDYIELKNNSGFININSDKIRIVGNIELIKK